MLVHGITYRARSVKLTKAMTNHKFNFVSFSHMIWALQFLIALLAIYAHASHTRSMTEMVT